MFSTMHYLKHILLWGLVFGILPACVHTEVHRIGRLRLQGAKEGFAPIMSNISAAYERVALITATAHGASSDKRLKKYLKRQGSVAGCDAITDISYTSKHFGLLKKYHYKMI